MSGAAFLVDGFAETKTGCATSVNEMEIEDGIIGSMSSETRMSRPSPTSVWPTHQVRPNGQGTSHAAQALQQG